MKIRSIRTTNHEVLGDIHLSFLDSSGIICDTIIFAGENGCGKSSILNLIYEFSNFIFSTKENQIRVFEVEINSQEYDELLTNQNTKHYFQKDFSNNILVFKYDTVNKGVNTWENCFCEYKDSVGNTTIIPGNYFTDSSIKKMFRALFSDTEINFNSSAINTVTSKNIDSEVLSSVKSSSNLATDVKQLLIDIQALDDAEMGQWIRTNPNKIIPNELIDIRTNRFRRAFDIMFPFKKYKGITNIENQKQVMFEEHGKEMYLEQLSSGEKQIVFRGGFSLKDKKTLMEF